MDIQLESNRDKKKYYKESILNLNIAMKSLEQLNKEIGKNKFNPHNLPIYEYIYMPPFGSDEFEEFRVYYIQNNGEKLEKYRSNLNPQIYVVFKIVEPHFTYDFIPIELFNQLNNCKSQ